MDPKKLIVDLDDNIQDNSWGSQGQFEAQNLTSRPVPEWRRSIREDGVTPNPAPSKFAQAEDLDAVRGRVLFLPPFERVEASTRRRHGALSLDIEEMWHKQENRDGFNHPVVILSRVDEYRVKCHLMTSFGGQKLGDKHRSSRIRQMYVPIEPSDDHPDPREGIPKLRFCWGFGRTTKPGYIVIREPIEIDWRDLELWQENDESLFFASYVQFDPLDMDKLDERTKKLSQDENMGIPAPGVQSGVRCHGCRFKSPYEPDVGRQHRQPKSTPRTCAAIIPCVRASRLNGSRPEEEKCPLSGYTFSDCARMRNQSRRPKYSIDQLKVMSFIANLSGIAADSSQNLKKDGNAQRKGAPYIEVPANATSTDGTHEPTVSTQLTTIMFSALTVAQRRKRLEIVTSVCPPQQREKRPCEQRSWSAPQPSTSPPRHSCEPRPRSLPVMEDVRTYLPMIRRSQNSQVPNAAESFPSSSKLCSEDSRSQQFVRNRDREDQIRNRDWRRSESTWPSKYQR